jgi:hypothetical protein
MSDDFPDQRNGVFSWSKELGTVLHRAKGGSAWASYQSASAGGFWLEASIFWPFNGDFS